jgi:hypothetical protein
MEEDRATRSRQESAHQAQRLLHMARDRMVAEPQQQRHPRQQGARAETLLVAAVAVGAPAAKTPLQQVERSGCRHPFAAVAAASAVVVPRQVCCWSLLKVRRRW